MARIYSNVDASTIGLSAAPSAKPYKSDRKGRHAIH